MHESLPYKRVFFQVTTCRVVSSRRVFFLQAFQGNLEIERFRRYYTFLYALHMDSFLSFPRPSSRPSNFPS